MADSSQMLVNWSAMEQGANQYQTIHTNINEIVTNLQSNLQSTLGADWHGIAQGGWVEVQHAWQNAQMKLAEIHAALQKAIITAQTNYENAENTNKSMWQS